MKKITIRSATELVALLQRGTRCMCDFNSPHCEYKTTPGIVTGCIGNAVRVSHWSERVHHFCDLRLFYYKQD